MALPNASIPDNSICLWGLIASGTNDNISTKTFGSAPNRQHWIHFSSCVNGTIGWSYYSIVFVEGSDNIYLVDQRNTSGTGSLSAGIQINSSTAYSVAGSPSLGAIAGTDATTGDDYYYEFFYGVQPANEVELTDFNILPYIASGNNAISGTVKNLGSSTITSLDVTWNDGNGANTSTISGLNIMANTNYTFTHPTQLNAVASNSYTIDLTATVVGDADLTNNTIQVNTTTLTSIPTKYVVGEEKTGTWCGWCPRGAVSMADMESNPNFIGIAVHNGDPMTIASYDGNIGTYIPGGYPGGGVDRVIDGDPSSFNTMYNARSSTIVPCAVQNITATYNTTTNEIEINTDVEFFGNITGNYRISAVIIEDDVIGGATTAWKQVNYYDNGGAGALVDPVSGFNWVGAGDPVSPVDFGGYDHVARSLSNNDILGDVGSLPSGSVSAGIHNYSFTNISGNVVDNINKSHAVVMVINADNGEILNAGKSSITPYTVGIEDLSKSFKFNIYPNPTRGNMTLVFSFNETSEVNYFITDAIGNIVVNSNQQSLNSGEYKIQIDGSDLSSGMYFVHVQIGDKLITKKISIIK